MPSTPRGQRTRQLIIERTAAVFDTYGFAGATLNHLVAATGLTRGAFYFHFDSKDSLAEAIVQTQQERWLPMIAELDRTEPDPLARLIRLTSRSALLIQADVVMRAGSRLMTERALIRKELWQSYPWWTSTVRRLLADAGDEVSDMSALATDSWPAMPADTTPRARGIAAVTEYLVASWTGMAELAAATERVDLPERFRASWMLHLSWLCSSPARCDELTALVERLTEEMRETGRIAEASAPATAETPPAHGSGTGINPSVPAEVVAAPRPELRNGDGSPELVG
jgi:AcrR family transcriptional regulator